MDRPRLDVLLTGLLTVALAALVLYEFWQFYSAGSVDLFGRVNGWHKVVYAKHPYVVLAVLATYAGMLACCVVAWMRAALETSSAGSDGAQ